LELALEESAISDDLLKRLVDFHGHLGPFLVLGLKAGMLANSRLGKDCFKMTAVVAARGIPPYSCLVDGVQFVTGCTMGKGNIKLRRSRNIYVLFSKGNKKLQMELRKTVTDSILKTSEKDAERMAIELLKRPTNELYRITE
jgi:formylmethanofuran dehydrogenase subunit E